MAFHKVQFLEWYCLLIYKYDLQPCATNKSTGEIYDDDTGLWRAINRENITKSYKSVIILDLQTQNGYINISNTVSVLFPLHHSIIEKHIHAF